MIAHSFDYQCPDTPAEAARLLSEGGVVLAGGTWLVPHMSRGERNPAMVVDIRRVVQADIFKEDQAIVLGACTTYDRLKTDSLVQDALPVLRIMAQGITGGRGITGQGTIGGAACYGSPASDVPGCLLALDARMRLVGCTGTREIPAASFFQGPFTTALRPDEFLSAIVVERPTSRVYAGYHKLKLSGSSWPVVTASCCVLRLIDGGLRARLAIGAAGPRPVVVEASFLTADTESFASLAAAASAALDEGWTDELADAEYRIAVAPEVARRAAMAAQETLHV